MTKQRSDQNAVAPRQELVPEYAGPGPSEDGLFDIANEWLTTKEAAAYLRLSEASLRNLTSNGGILFYKLGERNRYRLHDLRELLLKKRKGDP